MLTRLTLGLLWLLHFLPQRLLARVGQARLSDVVAELDGPDVEAIVQVGTNLSFVAQADRLEAELGKPVIAINAATLWHALREHGIDDRVSGSGALLREH